MRSDDQLLFRIHKELGNLASSTGLDLRSKKFVNVVGQPYYAADRELQIDDKASEFHFPIVGAVTLPSENQSNVEVTSIPWGSKGQDNPAPLRVFHNVPHSEQFINFEGSGVPMDSHIGGYHGWSDRGGDALIAHDDPTNSLTHGDDMWKSLKLSTPSSFSVSKSGLIVRHPYHNYEEHGIDDNPHTAISLFHTLPRVGFMTEPLTGELMDKYPDHFTGGRGRLMTDDELKEHHAAMSEWSKMPRTTGMVLKHESLGTFLPESAENQNYEVGPGNIRVVHTTERGSGRKHVIHEYDPENETLKQLAVYHGTTKVE